MADSLIQFEKDLLSSFVHGEYYWKKVAKKPLSYSFKFYALFSIFFAIIAAIIIWLRYILPIAPIIETLPSRIAQAYPSELEITIRKGLVDTNVNEPYFIPISRFEQVIYQIRQDILGSSTQKLDHILVIDTEAGIEEFYLYRTFAMLTRNHLIYLSEVDYQGSYEIKVIALDSSTNIQINSQLIDTLVDYLEHYTPYIPYLIIASIFIALLTIIPLLRLIHIALISLINYLISRVIFKEFSYSQIFQITLHVYLTAVIITSVVFLINTQVILPHSTFILTLIGSILIFMHAHKHTKVTPKKKTVKKKSKKELKTKSKV